MSDVHSGEQIGAQGVVAHDPPFEQLAPCTCLRNGGTTCKVQDDTSVFVLWCIGLIGEVLEDAIGGAVA